MEKEMDYDHTKNSPSQHGEISLAQKEELLANFNVEKLITHSKVEKFTDYAHYIAAQDNSINQALVREDERLESYQDNVSSDYLLEQQKRNKFGAFIKLWELGMTLDTRHKKHAEAQKSYSPKAQAVANKIAEESGGKVQCVVDKEFIDAFGNFMGTKYRGAALLGKRVIARDETVLEDEWLMRHEAIHCMQQRDLNHGKAGRIWFLKRLKLSGKSYTWLRKELKGSTDAANYATQNQLSERETYVNQLNPDYLAQRKPNAWREADTAAWRKAIVRDYIEQEKIHYQQQIDTLMEEYDKEPDMYKKKLIIEQVEDLKKFFVLAEKLDPEDRKYFIILKDEIAAHIQEDPRFQIKLETQENRKKRNALQNEDLATK